MLTGWLGVPDAAADCSYWSKWSFNAQLVSSSFMCSATLPRPAHRDNHERPIQSVKHTESVRLSTATFHILDEAQKTCGLPYG